MGQTRFDVIIVGARCAGASLATHLARAGLSVAVLDSSSLPSDQPMSTHLIQPPGIDELDRLGVGDAVRAMTPPLRSFRIEFDGHGMTATYLDQRSSHCLRRAKLDWILEEAALKSGADLRDESRVTGLIADKHGRLSGVEVLRAGRIRERWTARVVVGADGRDSTVAKLVGAREYLGYDAPRGGYWAYWPRPSAWDANQFYTGFEQDNARVAFPTDEDMILIGTAPPVERARRWRGNHVAAYLDDVRSCEPIGRFLGDLKPVSPIYGLLKARYFFRVSAGPGWALVGDAGHHKDFVLAIGISDAMRDARSLAAAIIEGGDQAIERYWRRRDVARIEMFRLCQDMGEADQVTALERIVARRSAPLPRIAARFGEMIDTRIAPYDLFPAATVLRWVGAAAMRGELRPIPEFLAVGRRIVRARRELRYRRRLLARAGGRS